MQGALGLTAGRLSSNRNTCPYMFHVGRRLARRVFPVPGGPIMRMLNMVSPELRKGIIDRYHATTIAVGEFCLGKKCHS
jgi:hypothetical protein